MKKKHTMKGDALNSKILNQKELKQYGYPRNLIMDIFAVAESEAPEQALNTPDRAILFLKEITDEEEKLLITLRYKKAMNFTEMGAATGRTRQAMHQKIHRVLKRLSSDEHLHMLLNITGPMEKMTVKDLPLSTRAKRVLLRNGITTVKMLSEKNREDIASIRAAGDKTVDEIIKLMEKIKATVIQESL